MNRKSKRVWGVWVKPKAVRNWRWLRHWPLGGILGTTKRSAERLARSYRRQGHGLAKAKEIKRANGGKR